MVLGAAGAVFVDGTAVHVGELAARATSPGRVSPSAWGPRGTSGCATRGGGSPASRGGGATLGVMGGWGRRRTKKERVGVSLKPAVETGSRRCSQMPRYRFPRR